MKATVTASLVFGLAALSGLSPARAQQAAQCPRLPADAALHWEEVNNPDLLFCKATDEAGGQPFTIMVSNESPFEPIRRLRAESTMVNGSNTWWYRTEIAARPEIVARETSVTLPNGRVAYINIQVIDDAGLQRTYTQISALGF